MKHIYEKHTGCEKTHCHICDGGLAHCTICNAAEGELTSDCPGAPVDAATRERVYDGEIDYVAGAWRSTVTGS